MPRTKVAPPAPVTPEAPDVRLVPIDALHLDPHNVRTHPDKNLTAIRDSLRAFGQQKPLVVTPDGTIIAGNGAWSAAKQLGWTHIAAQVSMLPPEQARAYAVADNRTGELSLWDDAALGDLLRDLHDQALPLPGWDETDLARLWGPTELLDVEPETHRANELRQQYGVEVGQLWALGDHRLACGDCTDPAVVRQLLGGVQPRLMVTDPPYGVEYTPEWRNEAAAQGKLAYAAQRTGHVVNDDRCDWSEAYLLFPGPVAYPWSPGGDLVIQTGQALQTAGFQIRNQLIWKKPHFPISRGHYTYQHEPCWYAVRKGQRGYWIGDASASTMWDIALDKNVEGGHSTQKPLECMARPIRHHDAPQVYDPFVGSGTTLVACQNLGRVCYALDIDPGYVAVTLHRWATLTGETPVLVEG